MASRTILFALAAAQATAMDLVAMKMISGEPCVPCNPSGATGTNPPAVGDDLTSVYVDLLDSVKDINFRKRWEDSSLAKRDETFCCRQNLDCVNVLNLNIPMCYDKFTTQYAFADGSWGSLTTGEYISEDGSKANLLTGEYTKSNGETGDIYSADPAEKPNTATLSIPPQWTAEGVGSAVPATEIASYVDATPTAPATTAAPTDSQATNDAGNAQNSTPASSESEGAANKVVSNPHTSAGMSIFTAIMYFIYAL
ncbi:hypothetical protein CC78DRAFT_76519 [Lojkania enalia]|uniref:Uncharacterized protein n=1 Tax=Lojkania enalia TaxID=147567 RepID=A0A9P4KEV7_9PLEO|nr:hypothetical protein CC78DRAFT_76519 [Didymosphaeria enalia]